VRGGVAGALAVGEREEFLAIETEVLGRAASVGADVDPSLGGASI